MDKKRGIINIISSIASRLILLIAALFVRRLLIQYIGNDVNGLNSLYSSIIGTLGVVELGMGQAIVYSMYKPIVDGDRRQVAALYGLNKRLYWFVGVLIFSGGLLVMPFLPSLIRDYDNVNVNVYFTFLLTLFSVVMSYLYSAKTALIEAYKENYITTGLMTISSLIRYGMQIAVILLWKSFTIFLICQIFSSFLLLLLTEIVARRKHWEIINSHEEIDQLTKVEVEKNVKAMILHKVGTIMVNSIDGIIISGFVGVVILGKYSNYTYVAASMVGIIKLFFTPLTSIIGHLCAQGSKINCKGYFDYLYCINFILAVVFFLGYYSVIDYVVILIFGSNLELSRATVFVITLNQFIQYMRSTSLLFRDASGTFYNDRWKPIVEGLVNLVLSLVFVLSFPKEFRVVGVIVATIITNLLICDIVEPFVVFKNVFASSPKSFYIRNYAYIGTFVLTLIAMTCLSRVTRSPIVGILVNGFVSIGVSLTLIMLIAASDKEFRKEIATMTQKTIRWARKNILDK